MVEEKYQKSTAPEEKAFLKNLSLWLPLAAGRLKFKLSGVIVGFSHSRVSVSVDCGIIWYIWGAY